MFCFVFFSSLRTARRIDPENGSSRRNGRGADGAGARLVSAVADAHDVACRPTTVLYDTSTQKCCRRAVVHQPCSRSSYPSLARFQCQLSAQLRQIAFFLTCCSFFEQALFSVPSLPTSHYFEVQLTDMVLSDLALSGLSEHRTHRHLSPTCDQSPPQEVFFCHVTLVCFFSHTGTLRNSTPDPLFRMSRVRLRAPCARLAVPRFRGQHEAHLPVRELPRGLRHRWVGPFRHHAAHPLGGGDDQRRAGRLDGLVHPRRRSEGEKSVACGARHCPLPKPHTPHPNPTTPGPSVEDEKTRDRKTRTASFLGRVRANDCFGHPVLLFCLTSLTFCVHCRTRVKRDLDDVVPGAGLTDR